MVQKVLLFQRKKDLLYFLGILVTLFSLSLSLEYYNYTELTKFDSQLVNATVLKQYPKTKTTKKGKLRSYQVLKLKSDKGFTFYTTASKKLEHLQYRNIQLELWAGKKSFYEFMTRFYSFSKILQVYPDTSMKTQLNKQIDTQHEHKNISLLYQALFSAKPLPYALQTQFSNLGISHLIAISGYHLGVLSAILLLLIRYPYRFFQNRYFPYRSAKRDTFFFLAFVLMGYLLFLESPPSLLRAFVMLVVGFFLYDRGIKIISMQTLLLTLLLIIALFPRLFFSIGFWLSIAGVYYIFLFLLFFKDKNTLWQFFAIGFWVYLFMLPYSLVLFGNFSLYHPFSIVLTSLFSIFYPLSIALHLFNYGGLLDEGLYFLLNYNTSGIKISLGETYLFIHILLSLLTLYKRSFIYLLSLYSFSFFIYAVYYIT